MSGQLMAAKEVAAYLGQSLEWTMNSLRDGTIPSRRIRRRWFVTRSELEAWLASEGQPVREPARRVLVKGGR